MKTIKLVFDLQSGECQVEAQGFKGPSCKQATDFLVKALGESSDFQKKAEWYETNIVTGLRSNLCGFLAGLVVDLFVLVVSAAFGLFLVAVFCR
jgi:hypothetical protein